MSNESKAAFLGMSHGTAANRLRKQVLFKYVRMAGDHFCFKCGKEIESVDDLSIEHKEPWEGRSVEAFWDLDNIAFSHLTCNRPNWHMAEDARKTGPDGTAWCFSCRAFLSTSNFTPIKTRWNGYHPACKPCNARIKREWRARTGKR